MEIRQGLLFRHDFGPRQNHLQEGVRPVVVVQNDTLNRLEGYGNVIVVPLTTKGRASQTYAPIQPSGGNNLTQPSWAITNQVFTIGKDDLGEELGSVTKEELFGIKQALRLSLGLA